MHNARAVFNANMSEARQAGTLFDYLKASVAAPLSFDDLLRSQLVNSVSAFDKLMHDLIRIGMVEIFTGRRPPTPKYLSEGISLQTHTAIFTATIPPKEHIFETALFARFKIASFQDPTKVADGLSFIWSEGQKWQKIAGKMGISDEVARMTLKLITDRRNAIVHEADLDPVTNVKLSIAKQECEDTSNFLERCGNEIVNLVTI